ncbi:hypothetical protein GCM10009759_04260 [Kitasatospora saccharophila]|uniref:Uncharacterized protein n=1 Tax=Kitasatospora saccharophila TaxID=407973 RepID=A0ABN2W6S9_9ACTN
MSTSKTTKYFPFPAALVEAQRELEAAVARRAEFLAAVPRWVEPQSDIKTKDGSVMPGGPGWSEEQREEGRRLLEAEQAAAHAVWGHPFWAELQGADRVAARTQLKHLPADWPPADEGSGE